MTAGKIGILLVADLQLNLISGQINELLLQFRQDGVPHQKFHTHLIFKRHIFLNEICFRECIGDFSV